MRLPIDRFEDFNEDKTPLIIYNGELEARKYSMLGSTFDIPTINYLI